MKKSRRSSTRRRLDALLRRAADNPSIALKDRRCAKPVFCEGFLELCDDECLKNPTKALEMAPIAVQLAEKIGDRHLIHRSQGVLAHGYIATQQWPQAGEALEQCRTSALACCKTCAADWLRRRGDLMVETRDTTGAKQMIAEALETLGPELDDDMLGRIRFIRGIVYHFEAHRDLALEDAGQSLAELSLETPQGYFLDTLAFVACFLQFSQKRRYYETAIGYLEDFRERLKGQEGWQEVRLRLAWVEGLVRGRIGERRKASDRLDRVLSAALASGPAKYAVAAMIDRSLLFARRSNEVDLHAIRQMVKKCQRLEVDKPMKQWLQNVIRTVSSRPERTFDALAAFRFTFTVPVPGLLAEGRLH